MWRQQRGALQEIHYDYDYEHDKDDGGRSSCDAFGRFKKPDYDYEHEHERDRSGRSSKIGVSSVFICG
jgi:hypothetical protein